MKTTNVLFFILIALIQTVSFAQRLPRRPVEIQNIKIESKIVGLFVQNIVELEFYNPNNIDSLEARLSFQTTDNSFVQELWLEINGKYKKAETFSKKTGRRIYERVTGKRLDPALLQTSGNGNYWLRVYPFKAHQTRKVKIEYYSTLHYDGTAFNWLFQTYKSVPVSISFDLNIPNGFAYYKFNSDKNFKPIPKKLMFTKQKGSVNIYFKFVHLNDTIGIVGTKDFYIWDTKSSESVFRKELDPKLTSYKIIENIISHTKLKQPVDARRSMFKLRGLGEKFISYLQKYQELDILLSGSNSIWKKKKGLWVYPPDKFILKESPTFPYKGSILKANYIDKFKEFNEVKNKGLLEQIQSNFLTRATTKLVLENDEKVNIIRNEELIREAEIRFDIASKKLAPPLPPTTEEDEVFEFYAVTEKPTLIKKVKPEYPKLARMANVEGSVVITVLIGKTGKVINASVFKSIPMLDEAALNAAKKCLFKPAKLRDRAVKIKMNIPFRFTLDEYTDIPEYSYELIHSDSTVWLNIFGRKFTYVTLDRDQVVIEKGFELSESTRVRYSSKEHFDLMFQNPMLIKYSFSFKNLGIKVNSKWYLIN